MNTVNTPSTLIGRGIERAAALLASETARYTAANPCSAALAARTRQHWLQGVPPALDGGLGYAISAVH